MPLPATWLSCSRRYPSTMAFSGAAFLSHLQTFWNISAESNVAMALEPRFGCPMAPNWPWIKALGAPTTSWWPWNGVFDWPNSAKLALERHFEARRQQVGPGTALWVAPAAKTLSPLWSIWRKFCIDIRCWDIASHVHIQSYVSIRPWIMFAHVRKQCLHWPAKLCLQRSINFAYIHLQLVCMFVYVRKQCWHTSVKCVYKGL